MARSKQKLIRLIRGAMGEIKADLIISGGKLVNVYSGEMLDGMEIADGGQVLEKLVFPVGGIFSLRPWHEGGQGLRRIQHRLKEMGSPFDKPIFALSFLPFVTLPALRITARGLVNANERKVVSLFAD